MNRCTAPSERVALATLLLDAAQQAARGSALRSTEFTVGVCRRLKRSRGTWERVAFLVASHVPLLEAPQLPTEALKRLLRHEGIYELRHYPAYTPQPRTGNPPRLISAAKNLTPTFRESSVAVIILFDWKGGAHRNANLCKQEHQRVDAAR